MSYAVFCLWAFLLFSLMGVGTFDFVLAGQKQGHRAWGVEGQAERHVFFEYVCFCEGLVMCGIFDSRS
jgi:hypothetical protein